MYVISEPDREETHRFVDPIQYYTPWQHRKIGARISISSGYIRQHVRIGTDDEIEFLEKYNSWQTLMENFGRQGPGVEHPTIRDNNEDRYDIFFGEEKR